MAQLDYAFLADYAQIEGEKLSAIGASFTHARVEALGGLFVFSVAGRIKTTIDASPVTLGVRVSGGDSTFEVSNSMEIAPGSDAKPYQGDKIGILFATGFALPSYPGLYEVFLELDEEPARRLAFDLSVAGA